MCAACGRFDVFVCAFCKVLCASSKKVRIHGMRRKMCKCCCYTHATNIDRNDCLFRCSLYSGQTLTWLNDECSKLNKWKIV